MVYVTERIVNTGELEEKIKRARHIGNDLLTSIESKQNNKSEYLANELMIVLHELSNFDIMVEKVKVKSTFENSHLL